MKEEMNKSDGSAYGTAIRKSWLAMHSLGKTWNWAAPDIRGAGSSGHSAPDTGLSQEEEEVAGARWHGALSTGCILDGKPPISFLHPVPDHSWDDASPDKKWEDLPVEKLSHPKGKVYRHWHLEITPKNKSSSPPIPPLVDSSDCPRNFQSALLCFTLKYEETCKDHQICRQSRRLHHKQINRKRNTKREIKNTLGR